MANGDLWRDKFDRNFTCQFAHLYSGNFHTFCKTLLVHKIVHRWPSFDDVHEYRRKSERSRHQE